MRLYKNRFKRRHWQAYQPKKAKRMDWMSACTAFVTVVIVCSFTLLNWIGKPTCVFAFTVCVAAFRSMGFSPLGRPNDEVESNKYKDDHEAKLRWAKKKKRGGLTATNSQKKIGLCIYGFSAPLWRDPKTNQTNEISTVCTDGYTYTYSIYQVSLLIIKDLQ